MQVFRLVDVGHPDRVIAFDSLPNDLIRGISTKPCEGLHRPWPQLAEKFYVLDYKMTNKDIEAWGNISSYVRKMADKAVRIPDDLSLLARPMAENSSGPVTLEPEDVPLVPLEETEVALDVPTVKTYADKHGQVKHKIEKKVGDKIVTRYKKTKHTCKTKGRWGKKAPVGTCVRCDEMTIEERSRDLSEGSKK